MQLVESVYNNLGQRVEKRTRYGEGSTWTSIRKYTNDAAGNAVVELTERGGTFEKCEISLSTSNSRYSFAVARRCHKNEGIPQPR